MRLRVQQVLGEKICNFDTIFGGDKEDFTSKKTSHGLEEERESSGGGGGGEEKRRNMGRKHVF
jgi:hypothetical protein